MSYLDDQRGLCNAGAGGHRSVHPATHDGHPVKQQELNMIPQVIIGAELAGCAHSRLKKSVTSTDPVLPVSVSASWFTTCKGSVLATEAVAHTRQTAAS